MGAPVVHFEILARDPERLQSYYAELFDWEIEKPPGVPGQYGLVKAYKDAAGNGIAGGVGAGPEGYAGHVTFYVGVPDVEAALVRAQELGGTRLHGPDEVPGAGVVLGAFADPEGHQVGVVQT